MNKNDIYHFFNTKGLLLIILIAFIIRIVFFVSLQPWENEVVNKTIIVTDAIGYNRLALSFLSNKSFEDFGGFRTPGYPLFIALLYSISSGSVWFILLIQILLSTISVLLVFKIANIIFSRKIAILSAFLFAIDIHQALYAVTLGTDTLFVFLFLASVFFLIKSLIKMNLLKLCLSGLILGISSMVRPVSYLFPFVVIFFILFISNLKIKEKLFSSALFGAIFLITISPWLFHNYSKYGEAKLTSQTGSNFLFCNVAATEAYKTGKSIVQVNKNFFNLALEQGIDTTNMLNDTTNIYDSFKNSQIFYNIAQNYIKDNFILYSERHLMGIVNMYAGLATRHIASIFHLKSTALNVPQFEGPNIFKRIIDFFHSKTLGELFIAFGLSIYLLINYLFALYAILILIKKNEKFVFLFVLIILYFSAITGVVGLARLKIPIMPYINILCAVGLVHYYDKIIDKISSIKN